MAKLIDTFRELPHKFHLPSGKAKASDKQLKQFKEFFDIRQCCQLGYPIDTTATAYDAQLNLMAIGTGSGQVIVCGAPGVQFNAQHSEAASVTHMAFLPNEGRLITLTSDNKLHKWELNGTEEESWHLDHVGELLAGSTDEEGQRATAIGIVADALWVGYDNGRLRGVDVKDLKFSELDTSSEAISKSLTDEVRSQVKGWSSIISIECSPAAAGNETKQRVAIGFVAGTVAIVSAADASCDSLIASSVELECIAWQRDASALFTGHSDGSYCSWAVQYEESTVTVLKQKDAPSTVYGPFPCSAMTSIAYRTAKLGAVTAFAGGLAKNTHAGRHSVTVLREQEHVCYDVASPVIGIELLCANAVDAEYDEPHSLLIVCQSELMCIDLIAPEWPCYSLPYLASIAGHSSVTVSKLYTQVSEPMRAALVAAAANRQAVCSKRDWPITGGKCAATTSSSSSSAPADQAEQQEGEAQPAEPSSDKWDLLVTGHADGSVGFWRLDGAQVAQLFLLNTARVFESADAGAVPVVEEGGYPPFRAIGRRRQAADICANPDPAMAIVSLEFVADLLIVGASAGQVIVWSLSDKQQEVEVDVRKVNADIVPVNSESYEWDGPAVPKVREEAVTFAAPLQPSSIVQVYPPAPVTSIAYSQRWAMLAAGTAQGLVVIDTANNKCLSVHSTLPAEESADQQQHGQQHQQQQSAGSQLTKSLRQSFRRFKKLRGGKKQEYTVNDEAKEEKKKEDKKEEKKKDKKKDKKEEKKEDKEEKKEEGEEKAEAKDEAAEEKKQEADAEGAAGASGDAKPESSSPEETKEEEQKQQEEAKETKEEEKAEEGAAAAAGEGAEAAGDAEGAAAAAAAEPAAPPPKTILTAAITPGQVQCLTFADTHLASPSARTAALFAGDNSGRVFAFQLTPASGEGESAKEAKVELSKELHLRHGAPVVSVIPILAGRSHTAVTDAAPSEDAAGAGPHELLVVSQEQVKLFSLPALKPRCKAKLTGQGSQQQRVLACGYGQFESSQRAEAREFGLAVSANTGETMVLSVPQLKLHAVHNGRVQQALTFAGQCGSANPLAVRREQSGLLSILCLTAKCCRYAAKAQLELEEGMRPKPAVQEPATPASATTGAEQAKKEEEEGEKKEDEAKKEGAAAEAEGKEAPAELDRSGVTPVAADITLDDIKEYATSSASPAAGAEPIPEEKRESAVSGDESQAVNGQPEADKVAEVKVSADVNEQQQAVTAGDGGNTEE